MTKIIEYQLLMDDESFGLGEKVNKAIEQGYHLYGDPNISIIDNPISPMSITIRCIQAVVKYEEPVFPPIGYDDLKARIKG